MKKFVLIIIFCLITSGVKSMENQSIISGIWWMSDYKKMLQFLDIKKASGKYGSYCLEVSEDEKNADVYFNEFKKVYKVKINKIKDLKYEMIYKNKKRTITIEIDNYANIGEKVWHFDDSSPYPSESIAKYNYDGRLYHVISGKFTVKECLDDIEREARLDEAESTLKDM